MDLSKLMEQAQKMQADLQRMEEELNATVYEGNSGGEEGVTVKMNGACEVQEVVIADDLMGIDNKDMLQDMILLAVNAAVEKAMQDKEDKLGSATEGLSIPGIL